MVLKFIKVMWNDQVNKRFIECRNRSGMPNVRHLITVTSH